LVSVECPVDGCDYSGSVGSVEGHISGSQSGGHRGKVGRHYRDELVDRAETTINLPATDEGELGESPDGSSADDHPEGGGDASSDDPPIPPGKALVASTLVVLGLALGTTTDAETSVEAVDDQDGADGDGEIVPGGLVDE
jgi:hypothetical protein